MESTITAWFFCTAIVSLLPLLVDKAKGATATWEDFWSDGQILLVASAIAAESLGEGLVGLKGIDSFPVILPSASLIVVASASMTYSDCVDVEKRENFSFSPKTMSILLFFGAIVLNLASKIVILLSAN